MKQYSQQLDNARNSYQNYHNYLFEQLWNSSPATPQNCKKVRETFLLAIITRHLFLASVLKFFQLQNEKKDQKKNSAFNAFVTTAFAKLKIFLLVESFMK